MELYQEIMQKYKEECFSRFPEIDAALVHDRCYQALHKSVRSSPIPHCRIRIALRASKPLSVLWRSWDLLRCAP